MKSRVIYILIFVKTLLFLISAVYADNHLSLMKKEYIRPTTILYPFDNPYSKEKELLGKMLFFDPRLSRSKIMSCASCHNPSFMWSDGLEKGIGDFHRELPRRTPSLLNLAWNSSFFWDGRSKTLEQQALDPIQSRAEMGLPLPMMLDDIQNIKGYIPYFKAAFPNAHRLITKDNIAKAIATFERGLISNETPFDQWIQGDENAISNDAKKGFFLFNTKALCSSCHRGWNFSDNDFHDIGLKTNDAGRFNVVKKNVMKHAFKTPGLREIDKRSPYMHNGSIKTLEDVIEHYNSGFIHRTNVLSKLKPLHLTHHEKEYLIKFLKTLSSPEKQEIVLPILPH